MKNNLPRDHDDSFKSSPTKQLKITKNIPWNSVEAKTHVPSISDVLKRRKDAKLMIEARRDQLRSILKEDKS